MTYTPRQASGLGGLAVPLNDSDRQRLTVLEGLKTPTPGQFGELHALRLRARERGDVQRTNELADKLTEQRKAEKAARQGKSDPNTEATYLR